MGSFACNVIDQERTGETIDRVGRANFLEDIEVDIDPNMINRLRMSPYTDMANMGGWVGRGSETMKFAVLINEGPYTHQASDSAYQFVKAALAKGHEIFRVFFYHDGVNNATRLTTPPQDDRNIVKRWSKLAEEHKLDLVVCVAAAQRRGIVDGGEAKRNGKDATNLAPGFRISGLGQLVEAGIEADRTVVFGD